METAKYITIAADEFGQETHQCRCERHAPCLDRVPPVGNAAASSLTRERMLREFRLRYIGEISPPDGRSLSMLKRRTSSKTRLRALALVIREAAGIT